MYAPLPFVRSGLIVLVAFGMAACAPAQTAQNNAAEPLIVDGNFDEANFVVPEDEGSGAENASLPAGDPATGRIGNSGTSNTVAPRR